MGQIIIDLPLRVKRHYKIDDVESANQLLADLQNTARRVEDNAEKLTAEDLADIRAAKRAREKGEFVAWEDAEAFLDTLK
ncbi:MAG: hypothetical protein M3Q99_12195 [Acidobacteriota bacterium]|nr:hypothetical protein [Acidobacteriota bacterium]